MLESAEIGHRVAKDVYAREEPQLREALLNAQFDLSQTARTGAAHHLRRRGRRPRRNRQQAHRMDGSAPHPCHRVRRAHARGSGAPAGVALLARAAAEGPDRHLLQRVVQRSRASRGCTARIDDDRLESHLEAIREHERMLTDEGLVLLKFWIHLSKAAQNACRRSSAIRALPGASPATTGRRPASTQVRTVCGRRCCAKRRPARRRGTSSKEPTSATAT